MKNLLKLLGAFVVSCFVMLDVNAMEEKQSQEGPEHKIGANCYFKVIKYPDFRSACRATDIEVNYKGKKEQIHDIYMPRFSTDNAGLLMYKVVNSLRETFDNMSEDVRIEIAKQYYQDIRQCYLEDLVNNKNS